MKNTFILLVATAFFGVSASVACHIPPNPPSCPSCPEGSSLIDIDFDDFYAGTIVGATSRDSRNDGLQRFTSAGNSAIEEGTGFTITVGSQPGECAVKAATLYDTDRRQYFDSRGNLTTDYEKAVRRDENWVGRAGSGEDSDLETTNRGSYPNEYTEWSGGGNMAEYNLGNALILQQNLDCNDIDEGHLDLVQGRDQSNYCDEIFAPNDYNSGGFIELSFESAMNGFGFTFADLDDDEISRTSITFFDTSGTSVTVTFDEFSTGVFEDRGSNNTSGKVDWGGTSANRIDTITVAELNNVMNTSLNDISKVNFYLQRSGGITHINYCHYEAVPEASTTVAAFGLFGLLGFHFMRRRKKAK